MITKSNQVFLSFTFVINAMLIYGPVFFKGLHRPTPNPHLVKRALLSGPQVEKGFRLRVQGEHFGVQGSKEPHFGPFLDLMTSNFYNGKKGRK